MPPPTGRGVAGFLLIVVVLVLQLTIYWPALVRPAHPASEAPGGAGGRNTSPEPTSAAAKRHSAPGRGRQRAAVPFDEEQDDDAISSALARDASRPTTSHGLAADGADGSVRPRTDQAAASLERDDDEYYYAPIIVGAGQGTTGTHLIAQVTCYLGFPSFHYAIGCLPKSTFLLAPDAVSSSSTCNPKISKIGEPYANLARAHWKLASGMLRGSREKTKWSTEYTYNYSIARLEEIVVWGKENKVKRLLRSARSRPCCCGLTCARLSWLYTTRLIH